MANGPHPLFGLHMLGDTWDTAGAAETSDAERMQALIKLAENSHLMPGPVFFQIPTNTRSDDWKDLYQMSVAACRCATRYSPISFEDVRGARRLLLPAQGRHRFKPYDQPQTVRLVTGTTDCLLAIGPHGADQAAAYMIIASQSGMLGVWQSPYAQGNNSIYAGHSLQTHRHGDVLWLPPDKIDNAVKHHGGLQFTQMLYDFAVPTCTIVGGGIDEDTGKQWVDVEIDASCSVLSIADRTFLHICSIRG